MKDDDIETVREKFLEKHDKEDLKHHYGEAVEHRKGFLAWMKRKKQGEEEQERPPRDVPSYPATKDARPHQEHATMKRTSITGKQKPYRNLNDSTVKQMAALFEEKEKKQHKPSPPGSRRLLERKDARKGSTASARSSSQPRHTARKKAVKHGKHKQAPKHHHLDDAKEELDSEPKLMGAAALPHQWATVEDEQPEEAEEEQEETDDDGDGSDLDPTSDVYLQRLAEQQRATQRSAKRSGFLPKIKVERAPDSRKEAAATASRQQAKDQSPQIPGRSMELQHPIRTGMKIGLGILLLLVILMVTIAGVSYFFNVMGMSVTGLLGLG